MKIYNIYDMIAERFAPPFVQSTDKMAVRVVLKSLKDSSLNSDEYELFHIGYYNENQGTIIDCEKVKVDLV